MDSKENAEKSLLLKIYEQMIIHLSDSGEFEEKDIKNIKELSMVDKLAMPEEIIKKLENIEGNDEDS